MIVLTIQFIQEMIENSRLFLEGVVKYSYKNDEEKEYGITFGENYQSS